MLYTLNFRKEVGYMFFSFACVLNAPNIQDETTCTNFIGKTLNAQLQNRMRLKKILIKKKILMWRKKVKSSIYNN